jgi:DNA-3-methyladenine glycosylase I
MRCSWATSDLMIAYHDREWGVPVHDDHKLFELLILEGAQAGLSWETVLKKREHYRERFFHFDPVWVARMNHHHVEQALQDPGIIRHRAKVESVVTNARAFRAVQKEHGSFDAYVWAFVGGEPRINRPESPDDVPAQTDDSAALSKDLKKRGFKFVGPTIVYSFMQAAGLVNDHLAGCERHPSGVSAGTT